ncbi:MAG: hypothetical protein UR66_C0002G0130 [Candidatus Moranbacteria bacterium GW2011_GWE1_35_17]|nr:MAG: hypothetical protein UR66_C0002G0130 [Candidatus Moranbacteria bacterium GW2011_GWE1_35_17]KKP84491.1 MAG: hypothetical protein UR82_C0004G0007 [Candidatus Moranbacteria bacterium GW2011_GWF1_35_5]
MKDKTTEVMEAIASKFEVVPVGYGVIVAVNSDGQLSVIGEIESITRRDKSGFALDSRCKKVGMLYGEIYCAYRASESLPTMTIERFVREEIFRRLYFESGNGGVPSFVGQGKFDPNERGIHYVSSR